MMLTSISGSLRRWGVACAAGLFLMAALYVAPLDRSPVSSRGSHRRDGKPGLSANDAPAIPVSNNHSQVRNYFMDFAGDHSLDVATVIEQASAGYAKYTVQLHLASGGEQSVVVSAPPGGLQIEMHDMTGDKVPNDIVLRPVFLQWLPTVLVNDGHEHFEVAVSGTELSSFSSREDLGSRRRDSQTFAFLMSSGLKTVHVPISSRLSDPQFRQSLFSSFSQPTTDRLGHASSPGRAPPPVTAI